MPQLSLSFLSDASPFWWFALVLALVVGTWAYYRVLAPLGKGVRVLLRTLRLAALGLLLLALLEPLLTLRTESSAQPRLTVLVDRSSSMLLPGRAEATRRDEAASALVRLTEQLADRFDLDVAGFATSVEMSRQAGSVYPWQPLGATALGDALEEILVRQAESPAGGVILLTDGIHTSGKDPALVARNLPLPVFGVMLGDTVSPPDLLVREVRAHPVAYIGEPLAFRIVLENRGLQGPEATVAIREVHPRGSALERGGVLARRSVGLFSGSGGERELILEVTPSHVGLTLFEIEAVVPDLEAVDVNNRRLVAVEVREKKTRILYLEGEPDWDFAFAKRILDADTTLSYSYLARRKDGGFLRYGSAEIDRLPRTPADLASFAAVVLSRISPGQLPHGTANALKQFLRDGGGVLFLDAPSEGPGVEAWSRDSWTGLLPLVVVPDRRWGFSRSSCGVTFAGLSHEITAIDESPVATEELWAGLPPIWIPEGIYTAAPGATVLLTARTAHPPREVPLLAIASVGDGRVGVLSGRGFWRWDFVMRSVSEGHVGAREFWRRMMRWLSEPVQRERFHVSPVRPVFQDSEPIAFTGRLFDEAFQPVPGGRLMLRIEQVAELPVSGDTLAGAPHEGAGSDRPAAEIFLYPDGPVGRYAGTVAPLPPGMYRYQAEADAGHGTQRRSWSCEGLFWVERMGPEFFRLGSSERLLSLLATASDGRAVPSERIDELLEVIPGGYRRAHLVKQSEMWNHWALFAFLIAMLSMEWVLRRRRGLA
jgi:hypothetical protein